MKKSLKTFALFFCLLFLKFDQKRKQVIKFVYTKPVVLIEDTLSLTKANVEKMVYKYCKHPKIVLRQAYFESGHLKSAICRTNNNIFGMKLPKRRKTLAVGENKGHASFTNWIDSIKDMALYQSERNLCCLNEKQYLNFIQRTYSTNNNYVKTLLMVNI